MKADPTIMWCECCGRPFKRWELNMVAPDPVAFRELLEKDPGLEMNFACPECIVSHQLKPLQTVRAIKFRQQNEKLRKRLDPQLVH